MKLNQTTEVFDLLKLLKEYHDSLMRLQEAPHIHITFPVKGESDAHLHYPVNIDYGLAVRLFLEQQLLLKMQEINNQLLQFGINVELD